MDNNKETELIQDSYCPECQDIFHHRVEIDWHYDGGGSYHFCKMCGKKIVDIQVRIRGKVQEKDANTRDDIARKRRKNEWQNIPVEFHNICQ